MGNRLAAPHLLRSLALRSLSCHQPDPHTLGIGVSLRSLTCGQTSFAHLRQQRSGAAKRLLFRGCPILGKRGFSLIELIMVLALLGIMAGVVAPVTGRFLDKLNFRKQTAALVAATRYARLMAVGKGRPVEMRFDGQSKSLSFSGAVEEKKEVELSEGAVFEFRPETLVFYPDGLATPGRMVSRMGRRSQEFLIDPLTGIPVRQ